ncbi:MAG: uncharacterized membrane protein YciS (DUF1049 family) [Oceanicoccus sp.]|jgi:uncharacterized membrane protein YciS (DUF1049 family)
MDSIIITGVLITFALLGILFLKGYLDKRRIERAREMMDLNDDLRRMQNAMAIIPNVYFDIPTRIFMLKRTMQLISKILESNSDHQTLNTLYQDIEIQLAKTLSQKDDSVKRLGVRGKVDNPDVAHEIRTMVKFLHDQILKSVKSGLIPKAHGSRVVKNLKIIMQRTIIDMNYNMAQGILRTKKLRPALSKFKLTLGLVIKSPLKQYLTPLKDELEKTIAKIENQMSNDRKKLNERSSGQLASGMDKMKEKEDWDVKKNIYD